jgi:hypothetical protein
MSNTLELENKIQLKILKWLRDNGYYCWRNANLQRLVKGKYINNPYHISGLPDIICILEGGKYLGIECKTTKGKQSVEQAQHERRVKALGGYYVVARSVKDVQEFLSTLT